MKNKRPRTESLPIDDMLKIHTESELSTFIMGHLVIESVLDRLIDNSMINPKAFNIDDLKFFRKVCLCEALGLLTTELSNYLKELNRIRNQFAHNLQHYLSFEEAVKLAKQARALGVKLNDEGDGFEGYSKFKHEGMDIVYLLHDILSNLAYLLGGILIENGGEAPFIRFESNG